LVELPCELYTRDEDAPRLAWGPDLSVGGILLETALPIDTGEDVVVAFHPALGWGLSELTVFAHVARAAHGRRQGEGGTGLGLAFLDLSRPERRELSRWLRPRSRIAAGPRRSATFRAPIVPPRGLASPLSEHPFARRVS